MVRSTPPQSKQTQSNGLIPETELYMAIAYSYFRGNGNPSSAIPASNKDSGVATETKTNVDAEIEKQYFKNLCRRCFSNRLGDNNHGDHVCFSCGLTQGVVFDSSPEWWHLRTKTYQRVFYFNERCSRWLCDEPRIDKDAWDVIYQTSVQYIKNNRVTHITRDTVNRILKSVELTPEFQLKHKSQKFKQTLMSKKRFYDKYSEKWKTIIWKLTGVRPQFPPIELVNLIKQLFAASQKPFDINRHACDCDKRVNCDKYFDCWHNFINYDFVFRKYLQIAELQFGWANAYQLYKDEFPLVSLKIREKKLRPLFKKICAYNRWQCPDDE